MQNLQISWLRSHIHLIDLRQIQLAEISQTVAQTHQRNQFQCFPRTHVTGVSQRAVGTPYTVRQLQAVVFLQEIASIAFFLNDLLCYRLQIGQNILFALADGALVGNLI